MADKFSIEHWDDLVGQEELVERLKIHSQGAAMAGECLSPTLLASGAGMGKTTIAGLIAKQLRNEMVVYVQPVDINGLVTIVEEYTFATIFFDEIHRWSQQQQENLLPLLETGFVDHPQLGKFKSTALSFVAATTEPNRIVAPVYDRFLIKPQFQPYKPSEMAHILRGMADRLNTTISQQEALALVPAAGGSPRNCKVIALAARDLQTTSPRQIMRFLRISKDGLNHDHALYLRTLTQSTTGKAGLSTLTAVLQQPTAAVQEVERMLIDRKLVQLSPGGRLITQHGRQALKAANYLLQ